MLELKKQTKITVILMFYKSDLHKNNKTAKQRVKRKKRKDK
jgi:hypothetical protein